MVAVIGWVQPVLLNVSLAPRIAPAQQPYYGCLRSIGRVAALAFTSNDAAIRATHVDYLVFEALLIVSALTAGVFGWVLAGIVRPTPLRTALVWFIVMQLVITRLYAVPPFWPQAWPLAVIAAAAAFIQTRVHARIAALH